MRVVISIFKDEASEAAETTVVVKVVRISVRSRAREMIPTTKAESERGSMIVLEPVSLMVTRKDQNKNCTKTNSELVSLIVTPKGQDRTTMRRLYRISAGNFVSIFCGGEVLQPRLWISMTGITRDVSCMKVDA